MHAHTFEVHKLRIKILKNVKDKHTAQESFRRPAEDIKLLGLYFLFFKMSQNWSDEKIATFPLHL